MGDVANTEIREDSFFDQWTLAGSPILTGYSPRSIFRGAIDNSKAVSSCIISPHANSSEYGLDRRDGVRKILIRERSSSRV